MEDTRERILVFFWLGQYINQNPGVVELEQENVRKTLSFDAAGLE
ncbi:MAG: hypothetical protein ABW092_10270 [Candidatus Thiodiazotropha sp.]